MVRGNSLGGTVSNAADETPPPPQPIQTLLPDVGISRATATPRTLPPIQTLLPAVDVNRTTATPRRPHVSKKTRLRERDDSGPWYALIRGLVGVEGSSWSGVVANESLALAATRSARPGSSTYFAYAPTKERAHSIVKSETLPARTCVHGPEAKAPRLHDVVVYTDGACKVLGAGRLSQFPAPSADDCAIRGIECIPKPVAANNANGTDSVGAAGAPPTANGAGGGRALVVSTDAGASTIADNEAGAARPAKSDAQLAVDVMAAGYGVWFGESCPFNVGEPLEGRLQSAARAELRALVAALEIVNEKIRWARRVIVRMDADLTDARKRVLTAKGNAYFPDRDLWQRLGEALSVLDGRKVELSLEWVKGHAESYGNYRADSLAEAGSVVKAMQINPFATEQLRRHIQFKPKRYEHKSRQARAWEARAKAEKRREERKALRSKGGDGRVRDGGVKKKKAKSKRKQSSEPNEGVLLPAPVQSKGHHRFWHPEPKNGGAATGLVDSAIVAVDGCKRGAVGGMSDVPMPNVNTVPTVMIEPDVVDLCTSDDSEVEIVEVGRAGPSNDHETGINATGYDGHRSDSSQCGSGSQEVSAHDRVKGGTGQNKVAMPSPYDKTLHPHTGGLTWRRDKPTMRHTDSDSEDSLARPTRSVASPHRRETSSESNEVQIVETEFAQTPRPQQPHPHPARGQPHFSRNRSAPSREAAVAVLTCPTPWIVDRTPDKVDHERGKLDISGRVTSGT